MASPPPPSGFQKGVERLRRPVLPLVRLLPLLFLATPHHTIGGLLEELRDPIEIGPLRYLDPAGRLRPHLDLLAPLEELKKNGSFLHPQVLTEAGQPMEPMEAMALWIGQQVLVRELEEINSLLCRPCGCTLCCRGPDEPMAQEFFEIPLQDHEITFFPVDRVDTPTSRTSVAMAEPPLLRDDRAFYHTGPALYHWRPGWSLILPRETVCPQLTLEGECRIYPQRPLVCRRPQIFPYLLEAVSDEEGDCHVAEPLVYRNRNMLLAVWDCPFVRNLTEEIVDYAVQCGLQPLMRENKA